LKNAPDDPVIRSIVEGNFETNKTKAILEDIEDIELQYEDDLFGMANSEMSLYLSDKLQMVDLTSTFSKIAIVYDKLQGGRFVGSAKDSNKAVKYINDNLLRKNKRGISAEVRSAIFIGIARIISDSRENSNSGNGDKVAVDEVKQYLARYARYSADVFVEKYATVDSIRFLYIQALRYLGAGDDGNIIAAVNMVIASFFMDSTKLPDELHYMGNSVYKDEYYTMDCVSTKDLLIATFMLQERQDYVTSILKKIYNETSLRLKVIESLNKMLGSEKNISEYYDFDAIWKKVKGIYYSNLEQLGKEIEDSINEYHMAESIRIHVQRIEDQGDFKKVITEDEVYESKTVIIATGAFHRQLNVPGEAEFNSRGVSYCAVCDGAFFRDEDLLVVGGGDSAVEEAIFLTQFAKSVTIVHRRDQLRAQKVLQDRAFANEKISFVWDSVVEAIHGDERKVTGVTFKNIKTGETSQADFGGIFIYVGLDPVSEFVADLGIRDESGWIVTDDHMKTSVAGIYAIGDVRQKDLRQITTAVGDGAIAGQEAYKYITEHE